MELEHILSKNQKIMTKKKIGKKKEKTKNCTWCKNSQIIGVISKTSNLATIKSVHSGYMSTTISISVVASTGWNHQYFHCCIGNNSSVE